MSRAPAASLAEYLGRPAAQIDAALARFLPTPPDCPSALARGDALQPRRRRQAAASDSDAGGRRDGRRCAVSRPSAIAAALPAACAIELIHTYSLIHDDLPAMDDDSLRRGRPTNHIVHGEGMAILAGDGLLTEAFALLSSRAARSGAGGAKDSRRSRSSPRRPAPAAWSAGRRSISRGRTGARPSTNDSLQDMHARKTGALIRASAVAGAIMAGAGDEAHSRRRRIRTSAGPRLSNRRRHPRRRGRCRRPGQDGRQRREGRQADLSRLLRPRRVAASRRRASRRRARRRSASAGCSIASRRHRRWVIRRTN